MPLSAADIQLQLNINTYVELASFVILCYDYLLTLPYEVEHFWKRSKLNWVTALFYFNRYGVLLGNLPILLFLFISIAQTSCRAKEFYQQFFLAVVQLVISILFCIRVNAIYEQNKKLLALMICAIIAMVSNGLVQWNLSKDTIGSDTANAEAVHVDVHCFQSYTEPQGKRLIYLWLGVVAVDFLFLFLTLFRTIRLEVSYRRSNMWTVIIRDGILYFVIITATNCANILAIALLQDFMKTVLAGFTNIIASIMMTRLMLNLRTAYHDMGTSQSTIHTGPLTFAPNQMFFREETRSSSDTSV